MVFPILAMQMLSFTSRKSSMSWQTYNFNPKHGSRTALASEWPRAEYYLCAWNCVELQFGIVSVLWVIGVM